MKSMEIIPAMDLIAGECVRLEMGNYSRKKIYERDPLKQAVKFEKMGFKTLHMVDLDGAKGSEPVNLELLEKIVSKTSLAVQFGGGIKSVKSAERAFSAGAKRVIAGSISVTNPEVVNEMIAKFGKDKIVLGVDLYEEKIAINGWLDRVDNNFMELVSYYVNRGIGSIVCTDIAKDGMMKGPSVKLYQKLIKEFPELTVIASGGISSVEDLELLSGINIKGVIVGKALYEEVITDNQNKKWLQNE